METDRAKYRFNKRLATYVSWSHHAADLLHRVKIWAQTAMHGEDLLVNNSSNGQAVETISKGLPELDIIPALAFVVEAVDTVDRGTFVVAPKDKEVLRILDLIG